MVRTPGEHAPNSKNRSSKHLIPLTGYKPAIKSLSNAALSEMNCKVAQQEKQRRAKKHEKKDMK